MGLNLSTNVFAPRIYEASYAGTVWPGTFRTGGGYSPNLLSAQCELLIPSASRHGLSFILGAGAAIERPYTAGSVGHFPDSSLGYSTRVQGGELHFGLNLDKHIFPWMGFYGKAALGRYFYHQQIQISRVTNGVSTEQQLYFPVNGFGVQTAGGLFFEFAHVKIRGGLSLQALSDSNSGDSISMIGYDMRIGFGF
jgi:hypothetical protein